MVATSSVRVAAPAPGWSKIGPPAGRGKECPCPALVNLCYNFFSGSGFAVVAAAALRLSVG